MTMSFAEDPVSANVALLARVDVPHSNGGVASNINNGIISTSYNPSTTWNTWGTTIGTESNPFYVTLVWDEPYILQSMRVMWWVYIDNGVHWPRSCRVEYLSLESGQWVDLGPVGTDHKGEPNRGASGWVFNDVWNEVIFTTPIKTTSLRLRVVANKNSGTSPGFGINEWEVYGFESEPELISVSISGKSSLGVGIQEEYTASVVSPRLEGVTYEWSVDNNNAKIVGSPTGNKAMVEGLAEGTATISVKAKHPSGVQEAVGTFNVQVREIKPLTYKTATAAGRPPILPKRVVMQGIQFDTPTPSAVGNNGFNFGEEFNDSLIPVERWDEVPESAYAADKIGTTFTVNGNVRYGGKDFPVTAEITVNPPLEAPTFNNSVTSEHVKLNDVFWSPKQRTNALDSLDTAIDRLARTSGTGGGESNFTGAIARLNGQQPEVDYIGYVFQDTDIYKTLEAMAYTLFAIDKDTDPEMVAQKAKLKAKIDQWIGYIEAVQYADGYINTCFTMRSNTSAGGAGTGQWRWRYFERHEMYNIGHLLEAVVAYTRYSEGTGLGDYRLYEVGKRAADHIVDLFGPGGKRNEVPGHEEIELALMKFARLVEEFEGQGTGQKYRDTAKLLIDRRGTGGQGGRNRESGYSGGTYSQDATRLVDEVQAVGHAVRAAYYYTGATDVAASLPEDHPDRIAYLNVLDRINERLVNRNQYITGGVGSSQPGASSEGFGSDYALSNMRSYCEICAAIAVANWNQRMNLVHEDAKYADYYEKALYNAILVGVNLSGGLFYYSTLLHVPGGSNGTSLSNRSSWFGCACCPPNLMRTIANIGGYMYTVNKDKVFVNLYAGSTSDVNVQGTNVQIDQVTNYPWEGNVLLTVKPEIEKEFTLNIRIPGWLKAQKYQQVTIKVNGQSIDSTPNEKGYVPITMNWPVEGTTIEIDIPMEIRFTEPDNNVHNTSSTIGSNRNRVAIERGPIVYCLETPGLPGGSFNNATQVTIPRDIQFTATWRPELLRGVVELKGTALYGNNNQEVEIRMTPYYAWNNRGNDPTHLGSSGSVNNCSSMVIWLNSTGDAVQIRGDKFKLSIDETTTLTAVPHVNYNSTNKPGSYEWRVEGPVEIIDTTEGITDNTGYTKIGGIGFELPTSIATVKATGYGTATVTAVMKNGNGDVVATDTYEITVDEVGEPEGPATEITADSSVNPGATFTVGINLKNLDQPVHAEDITVFYDPSIFEYVGATGANDNIKVLKEDNSTSGIVRLIAANIGGISGTDSPVININFKVKPGVENITKSIAIISAKLGMAPDGAVIDAGLSSKCIRVGSSSPSVDKSALIAAINSAQELYDDAEVGTAPGQYPQAAKDALNIAINEAKAVRDDPGATQSQVDSAVTALNNAIDIFRASVNKSADINNDGSTNIADLAIAAYYFGKTSSDEDWSAAKIADMNGDNTIDILDLAYIALQIIDE